MKIAPDEPTMEMLRSAIQREHVDASHYGRLIDTYKIMMSHLANVEPVVWQYRTKPTWVTAWGPWQICTERQAAQYKQVPILNDWEYETRTLGVIC